MSSLGKGIGEAYEGDKQYKVLRHESSPVPLTTVPSGIADRYNT
jgi:hypothetical protein